MTTAGSAVIEFASPPEDDRWLLVLDTSREGRLRDAPWVIATRCDGGFCDEEGYPVQPERYFSLPDPQPAPTGWRPPEGEIVIDTGTCAELNWKGWLIGIMKPDGTWDEKREPVMCDTEDEAAERAAYMSGWMGLPIRKTDGGKVVPFVKPEPPKADDGIRQDRVTEMADWLDTIPPEPPFYTHGDFSRFSDLTEAEMDAVQVEMRRRAAAASAEADALRAELARRK